jgi:hypothetical protein
MPFRWLSRGNPGIAGPGGWTLLGVCLCFALGVLFSENFTGGSMDHDCPGGECPVCPQIQLAMNFSMTLRHAVFHLRLCFRVVLITAVILKLVFHPVPVSAVRLKVKMNH